MTKIDFPTSPTKLSLRLQDTDEHVAMPLKKPISMKASSRLRPDCPEARNIGISSESSSSNHRGSSSQSSLYSSSFSFVKNFRESLRWSNYSLDSRECNMRRDSTSRRSSIRLKSARQPILDFLISAALLVPLFAIVITFLSSVEGWTITDAFYYALFLVTSLGSAARPQIDGMKLGVILFAMVAGPLFVHSSMSFATILINRLKPCLPDFKKRIIIFWITTFSACGSYITLRIRSNVADALYDTFFICITTGFDLDYNEFQLWDHIIIVTMLYLLIGGGFLMLEALLVEWNLQTEALGNDMKRVSKAIRATISVFRKSRCSSSPIIANIIDVAKTRLSIDEVEILQKALGEYVTTSRQNSRQNSRENSRVGNNSNRSPKEITKTSRSDSASFRSCSLKFDQ